MLFRSNTHTLPSYRVPLIPETHEAEHCKSEACQAQLQSATELKAISQIALRVQRELTGYHCGYTFKRQPVGRRYLKAAAECVNHLHESLEQTRAGQRWHRLSHRLLTDFQHKCMTRPAASSTDARKRACGWSMT